MGFILTCFFCINSDIDWNAVGAIGQILGALATFIAAAIALKSLHILTRSKYKFEFGMLKDIRKKKVITESK